MPFSVSLFLLQWSIGSLGFLWLTTRHRIVGLGYGWITRIVFIFLAGLSIFLAEQQTDLFKLTALAVAIASSISLIVSYMQKDAGVSGQNKIAEERSKRVSEMTGIERSAKSKNSEIKEFNPSLDLLAPIIGFVGLIVVGLMNESLLAVSRVLFGTLFLGAVTDAMLLGHWYLVQPGLKRDPLKELVYWTTGLWAPLTVLFLIPTGMFSVFSGTIDDGYVGLLGWFWAACVVTTLGLLIMTIIALKEKQYSAVMAATGLLYLAILTAFGIDLVARALLI